ncbi:unnamed protein product [Ectocarpus sp. CCAP 1310/34]|nr:unnamed protein product [Ectocarpus sp. CCAP 1310/34]
MEDESGGLYYRAKTPVRARPKEVAAAASGGEDAGAPTNWTPRSRRSPPFGTGSTNAGRPTTNTGERRKSTIKADSELSSPRVFESILKLMESSSNNGSGDAARDDATDRAQQVKAERMAVRQAHQEARGNVTAIMELLQDQVQSLEERNVEDVEWSEKHLERLAAEADCAKKQDAQYEDLPDFMSSTFRTPAGGVVMQWYSYEEFWECLPNIPDAAKSLVTGAPPTLTELVDLAKDKNFAATLKEAGDGTIPATWIASFIQRTTYDAK